MIETGHRSAKRFDKRNRLVTAKNRPRQFIQTPGATPSHATSLSRSPTSWTGKLDVQPDLPPKFLREPVLGIDSMSLALAALAPLLDGIFRPRDRDDPSAGQTLKQQIGDELYHQFQQGAATPNDGGRQSAFRPFNWLLEQAMALDVFGYDEDGLPCLSDEGLPHAAQLREDLIAAAPAYAPRLLPPAPWTGWEKSSDGFPGYVRPRLAPRDQNGDQRRLSSTRALLTPQGSMRLAACRSRIDPVMLALVEQFAVVIMDNEGRQRRADQITVAADVTDARYIGNRVFWCDYNFDKGAGSTHSVLQFRSRGPCAVAVPVRQRNEARGDIRTGSKSTAPIAKAQPTRTSRAERIEWVTVAQGRHRGYRKISSDSINGRTLLAVRVRRRVSRAGGAWNDPENFETHLPMGSTAPQTESNIFRC